ncbi:MAG TPA: hypothetical protein VLA17_04725, partial [Candidatus Limnocylindria bacterium]|nr:hypothetical protein [Candidatus Limnocylindria bacterium]
YPWELAEGGSAGSGLSIHFRSIVGLKPFAVLPAALQVRIFRPLPIAAGKRFAVIRRAVDFALKKNELPKTRFFRVVDRLIHFRLSLFSFHLTNEIPNRHRSRDQ